MFTASTRANIPAKPRPGAGTRGPRRHPGDFVRVADPVQLNTEGALQARGSIRPHLSRVNMSRPTSRASVHWPWEARRCDLPA